MNTNYEISLGTLAIVPNEEFSSLVFEDNNRYVVQQTPFEILKDSCQYFGSTYEGRRNSSKLILGGDYKVPILIESSHNLILIPTASPYSSDCSWISLIHIKELSRIDKFNTLVIFDNDCKVIINCSYRSLENQILRATKLSYVINQRMNK